MRIEGSKSRAMLEATCAYITNPFYDVLLYVSLHGSFAAQASGLLLNHLENIVNAPTGSSCGTWDGISWADNHEADSSPCDPHW